ncbi:MAG: SGNH/GDSL hydrolase family protein [Nitrosopumilus sp.]|nr:SGNH/GDSL hydrolase family protein [Nitrosopumilus sp.]
MSIQISYKKQITFFILLILISLGIFEISLRVYDYYFPNCNFLKSEVYDDVDNELKLDICRDNNALKWNTSPLYLIPNQNFKTINVNSDGFRGNELKLDQSYRIFVIGGSTTFGVGSTSDSTTIPYFLQEKLIKENPNKNIEVINAGIPQAYSFTEINLIKKNILNQSPNMIIIYDGWNDLEQNFESYELGTDPLLLDKIVRAIGKSDYVTPKILLTHYFNLKQDTMSILEFNNSNMKEKVTAWKTNWEGICKLGLESDFKVIITLQPLVGTGNKILSLEESTYFKKFDGQSKIDNYNLYHNALNELDSECSATFSLQNVFDSNSETIFYDFGHVGDLGNEIIADNIYEKILPIILKDISK